MTLKIMNVDVDLVVADALPAWLEWFKENSRDNISFDFKWSKSSYDLQEAMSPFMDIDPMDFWRQKDLYNKISPMKDAARILEALSEKYRIRFVTDSHPMHRQSKNDFLARNFTFDSEVYHVPSSEKWEFDADVWIEDKVETLDTLTQTQPDCEVFHMVNDLNRDYRVEGALRVSGWTEIARRLL